MVHLCELETYKVETYLTKRSHGHLCLHSIKLVRNSSKSGNLSVDFRDQRSFQHVLEREEPESGLQW